MSGAALLPSQISRARPTEGSTARSEVMRHMQALAHSVQSHLRRLLTRRKGSSRALPHAGPHAPRNEERAMRIRIAVIPAAGLGTRMLPATKAVPKEMLPLADVPTIQY